MASRPTSPRTHYNDSRILSNVKLLVAAWKRNASSEPSKYKYCVILWIHFFSANNYANDWSNDSKTTLKFIRSQLLFIFMLNVLWTNGHKRFFLLNWKVINDRNGISTKILFHCRSILIIHDCFLCYVHIQIQRLHSIFSIASNLLLKTIWNNSNWVSNLTSLSWAEKNNPGPQQTIHTWHYHIHKFEDFRRFQHFDHVCLEGQKEKVESLHAT